MAKRTDGVRLLVEDVLRTFSQPYSEDIIEDVFLAVEYHRDWRRRYDALADELRDWVVNNWIGQYTKEITGLQSLREVEAKRSNLITAYTKLGSPDS